MDKRDTRKISKKNREWKRGNQKGIKRRDEKNVTRMHGISKKRYKKNNKRLFWKYEERRFI